MHIEDKRVFRLQKSSRSCSGGVLPERSNQVCPGRNDGSTRRLQPRFRNQQALLDGV